MPIIQTMLSIDPSTTECGFCFWRDDEPIDYSSIRPSGNYTWEKIRNIIQALEQRVMYHEWRPVWIVCEKAMAIEKFKPAPALQTLIVDLKNWNRIYLKAKWVEMNPSTMKAATIPRGVKWSKEATARTMKAVYNITGLDSLDVTDAIGVGHAFKIKHETDRARNRMM